MSRLVILDPALRRRAGHHFNYAAALRDAAHQRDMEFLAFSHMAVEASVSDSIPVKPAFRVDTYQALENPGIPRNTFDGLQAHEMISAMALSCFLTEDLRQIESQLKPGDIVFFHTITHAQLLGLAQWLATSGAASALKLRLVVLLRFWHPFPAIVAPLFKVAATALNALPHSVRLCSDTFELAIAYGEMTGVPVDVVPIPHTAEEPTTTATPGAAPLISYLGHPRIEKGSQLLVEIVDEVLAACPAARFVLQQPPSTDGHELADQLKALQARRPGQIELADSDLSREDYNRHLSRSQIVLLSYDPNSYRYRSSGVFIEAAAAGKIVVVPARSSMQTEAQKFQCATVTFPEFKAPAIAAATIKAVQSCDALAPAGLAARDKILAYHNGAMLLNYLVG